MAAGRSGIFNNDQIPQFHVSRGQFIAHGLWRAEQIFQFPLLKLSAE